MTSEQGEAATPENLGKRSRGEHGCANARMRWSLALQEALSMERGVWRAVTGEARTGRRVGAGQLPRASQVWGGIWILGLGNGKPLESFKHLIFGLRQCLLATWTQGYKAAGVKSHW